MKKVVITIMCVMLASLSLFFISCGKKHDLVKVERTEATCETDGNIEYYKCNECDKWFTDDTAKVEITDKSTVVIAKLGHDYDTENIVWTWTEFDSATATFVCKHDSSHKEVVNATITNAVTAEPTCTVNGVKTYTATATFNGKDYIDTKTEDIPAIGHDYDKDNGVWTWTDYSAATISFTCRNDNTHVNTITATITSEITTAATCTADGVKTYTAKATFDGVEYTDTKTEVLNATGHNYDTENIVWAWTDFASATATFTCKNDASHKEVIDATITNAITTEPTCTATGVKTYTATVTFNEVTYTDTKTEDLAMLPHTLTKHDKVDATCESAGNIEYWTCDVCGKYFSDGEGATEITQEDTVIAKLAHNFVDGVCSICGKGVYEVNPFEFDNEKLAFVGFYDDASYVYRDSLIYKNTDGVMDYKEFGETPFTATMRKEVVNEFIRLGHKSFDFVIGRMYPDGRENKTTCAVSINGGTTKNDYATISVNLEADTPAVIPNISLYNNGWEGWRATDGFSIRINMDYSEKDPAHLIKSDYPISYSKADGYIVKGAPAEKDMTIQINPGYIKYLKDVVSKNPQSAFFKITAKTSGTYGGAIGAKIPGTNFSSWSGTTYFDINSLRDDGLMIFYYGSGKGTGTGFTFKIGTAGTYEYRPGEWLSNGGIYQFDEVEGEVNTLDVTHDPSDKILNGFGLNKKAVDKLISLGYKKINVTITNKPGEVVQAGIGGSTAGIKYTNGKSVTDTRELTPLQEGKYINYTLHYVLQGQQHGTGFRLIITFEK